MFRGQPAWHLKVGPVSCSETSVRIARAERDGRRAETRFRLSPKRTSPFKSVGASVQSTAGSRGVRISLSNVGYTTFGGGVRVLATHSIHQFPLHFPSRASPCATTFRTSCNYQSTWETSQKSEDLNWISIELWISQLCSVTWNKISDDTLEQTTILPLFRFAACHS